MVPYMKKSRLILTLAILGTGAVMAGSYLTPTRAPTPSAATKIPAKPAMTQVAPVNAAPGSNATVPAATTVVAPQAPLFRSATTAAPIGTSEPELEPARVRHTSPLLEAAVETPARAGHEPGAPDAATAAMPSMTPPPAAATGLAAAEPGMEPPTQPAETTKGSRKSKLSSKAGSAKPTSKRVEALFLHPLGMR